MYGICKEKYYFEHELAEDRSGVVTCLQVLNFLARWSLSARILKRDWIFQPEVKKKPSDKRKGKILIRFYDPIIYGYNYAYVT